jgi:hypothetical protein
MIQFCVFALVEEHEGATGQNEEEHSGDDQEVCPRVRAQCRFVDCSEQGIGDLRSVLIH